MFNKIYYIGFGNSKKIDKILNLLKMANETLQELLTRVQGLEQSAVQTMQSLSNIDADIDRIKEGLPQTGGLTEAEVVELRSSLDQAQTAITAAKDAAASLDLENEPAPPAEPEA